VTPLNLLPLLLVLPKADSSGWVALIVAICATAFVYFRTTRNWRKRRDPLAKPPAVTSLAQQRSAERQMQTLLVEMSEMARQIGAQLETRATKLDLLIREADDKLRQLHGAAEALAAARARVADVRVSPSMPVSPTPRASESLPIDDRTVEAAQESQPEREIQEPATTEAQTETPDEAEAIAEPPPAPVPVTAMPVRSAASSSASHAPREPAGAVEAGPGYLAPSPPYPIHNGKRTSEPRGAVSAADAGLDNVAALSPDAVHHFDDSDDLAPPPAAARRRGASSGHDALLPTNAPLPLDPRHVAVYELADKGLSIPQIAQRLSRPAGEVELILALRPRQERLV
jgi:hypothetical protein